jgi:hypothetical protein
MHGASAASGGICAAGPRQLLCDSGAFRGNTWLQSTHATNGTQTWCAPHMRLAQPCRAQGRQVQGRLLRGVCRATRQASSIRRCASGSTALDAPLVQWQCRRRSLLSPVVCTIGVANDRLTHIGGRTSDSQTIKHCRAVLCSCPSPQAGWRHVLCSSTGQQAAWGHRPGQGAHLQWIACSRAPLPKWKCATGSRTRLARRAAGGPASGGAAPPLDGGAAAPHSQADASAEASLDAERRERR